MSARSGQDELVHLILRRCLKLAVSKNSMRNLPLQEAASIKRFPTVNILLFTAQQIQEMYQRSRDHDNLRNDALHKMFGLQSEYRNMEILRNKNKEDNTAWR
ncbi:hypothetical protein TIFTF001_029826 [Ficus carica]|uniref:Uncharacterized protein n=1 Tax=Ficus carica TaxID=3494 RepID=A0AA88DWI0_FICCA|nr:hypothetical protein TIFTF001_029826 [Ficus carica]